ncbi:MAG: hypothetical protein A2750_01595 [Candidatus Yanofskybacteria bacterium RIFCSPHIGHO2_01_FULL_45_42]|uniref:Uncharacterized protein n=2 Tax=Candidatus Yanofskyibacteriota TaxID=1752733 RepID=A0A1F8H303_9BACT|nr:MAG: hypothetical protein A2750_01595 [Candidatus Yanofskybacteria bacterium RIFCSPHIGHO2_01_FULL_45_42]OGN26640.1 MAG: hypothetical protein A3B17_00550 [Candidatus Yanofskybacteria bacterium RIFCSPLOWO2_01_FULL_45_72]OGN31983.1 MAG: hypothetical protein A3J01_02815 [Candidatus Yanofskybacteria bacterium RIFCSPLOWO2_02_FULL_45_18]
MATQSDNFLVITELQNQLIKLAVPIERKQRDRQATLDKLQKKTQGFPLSLFLMALFFAGISEILSIFDAGWVTSWILAIILWFVKMKIDTVMRNANSLSALKTKLESEFVMLRQKLSQAAIQSGRSRLLGGVTQKSRDDFNKQASQSFQSYTNRFIKDLAIFQGIELIPVVDAIVPGYFGQVAKVFLDHRKERMRAFPVLMECRSLTRSIKQLEDFELELQQLPILEALNQLENEPEAETMPAEPALSREELSENYAGLMPSLAT